MNNVLRISLLFSFLSAYFYSLGVTTSENYVRIIRPIEGSEQALAIKLNRVLEFGTTRADHFGTAYYVSSPDSDEYESITITVDKNKLQKATQQ